MAVFIWLVVPVSLSAQTVDPRIFRSEGAARQLVQRLQQAGMGAEEIRDRLIRAGYDPEQFEALLDSDGESGAAIPNVDVNGFFRQTLETPDTAETTLRTRPDSASAFTPMAPPPVQRPGQADLKPFGAELFRTGGASFSAINMPPGPDYPLGPSDEMLLMIWGEVELQQRLVVSRDGFVFVRNLGPISVNGLNLAQLKETLTRRLAGIYSGIDPTGDGGNTFIELSLGRLRSIQVYILGEVSRPGSYTVSAVSTVLNALYAVGGPSENGSMRSIRVIRNGRTVAAIDLYPYILNGDASNDIRLQNGDIIFADQAGKRVTVTGEVYRQAIFELKEDEGLKQTLAYSGGVKTSAYLERMQIDRTIPFRDRLQFPGEDRRVVDINLRSVLYGEGDDPIVEDQDIITVFPINDIQRNTVTLRGHAIRKPGVFQYTDGMKISDLIDLGEGYEQDIYLERAHVLRINPDQSTGLMSINLGAALQGDPMHNLTLQAMDTLQVYSVWDFQQKPEVTINGMIRSPGSYPLFENMTLADLIVMANGLERSAYRLEAEIARVNPENITQTSIADIITVPLDAAYALSDETVPVVLQQDDQVFIRQIPGWQLQQNITIAGEVRFPGEYTLRTEQETIRDLIDRSGGLTEKAYLSASKLIRDFDETGQIDIDFNAVMQNRNSRSNIPLVAGDRIIIEEDPKVVKVQGKVNHPVSIMHREGAGLDYYLDHAGGLQEMADKKRIYIIQPNGQVMRKGKPLAGAVVMVPEKAPSDRQVLRDVASILSIVASTATTILLIQQIR